MQKFIELHGTALGVVNKVLMMLPNSTVEQLRANLNKNLLFVGYS